jgi:hypothetical protein
MQLRTARLCLDCEEIHDLQQCPLCASESFAYITRWIPAPVADRRSRPRPATPPSEELTAYARLAGTDGSSKKGRTLSRGLAGLAVAGVVGWIWNRSRNQNREAS